VVIVVVNAAVTVEDSALAVETVVAAVAVDAVVVAARARCVSRVLGHHIRHVADNWHRRRSGSQSPSSAVS
jgi:hypothetical protein